VKLFVALPIVSLTACELDHALSDAGEPGVLATSALDEHLAAEPASPSGYAARGSFATASIG